MTLVDAGPLIAMIDRMDRSHEACVDIMTKLSDPLVTTWPTIAEGMFVLGRRAGWYAQDLLWSVIRSDNLVIHDLDEATTQRAYTLMNKYRDLPMDLADATLVALAEALGRSRIFTLDSDFHIYKIKGRKAFDVVP